MDRFPGLTSILERFFEGGMVSHPRLTTSTLFHHEKNNLFTRQGREYILMHAPPFFDVSLSTCYNYTMNYREDSRAAIQHHHGRGINADISLKRSPSLSTCYNYTMKYHENMRAAKQHHHGRGINADISLKRSPSLSRCYNYTMNYRENSSTAKQHHRGRGINANRHLPPKISKRKFRKG